MKKTHDFEMLTEGDEPTLMEYVQRGKPSVVHCYLALQGQLYFLIYPFCVLSNNRILNTVISRKPKKRLLLDFRDTYQIGGLMALYAGFSIDFLSLL